MEHITFPNATESNEAFYEGSTHAYTQSVSEYGNAKLSLCTLSISTSGNTSLSIAHHMIPQKDLLATPKFLRLSVFPKPGENFRLSRHGRSEIVQNSMPKDITTKIIDVKDLLNSTTSSEVSRKLQQEPNIETDVQNFTVIPPDLATIFIKAGAVTPEDFIKATIAFARRQTRDEAESAFAGVLEFLCYARAVYEDDDLDDDDDDDDDDKVTHLLAPEGVTIIQQNDMSVSQNFIQATSYPIY